SVQKYLSNPKGKLNVTTHIIEISSKNTRFSITFSRLRKPLAEDSLLESPLSVRLTNGQTVKGTAGVTTPRYIGRNVSEASHDSLVCKVNGALWELGRPLEADCELQLLGFDSAEGRQVCTTVLETDKE
uniref:threonine--tRNA ligase n=1 Tax=Poecilia reticulata TaxID=8081 RepID=A0A3P9PV06_POERE